MDSNIVTYLGHGFDPLNPDPERVHIEDIAHALSNICRFTGHTPGHYSVAQHSLHVSNAVWGQTHSFWKALQGLLHDGSEAYICDLARPIKHSPGIGAEYRRIEARVMSAVYRRFGLPVVQSPAVTLADHRMLVTERETWGLSGGSHWPDVRPYPALVRRLRFWSPHRAEQEFLRRFTELRHEL